MSAELYVSLLQKVELFSMSRTYKAPGINLKGIPMGESDRLLTILTQEFGLIRALAPGSRKHHSRLSGRSGLFVVNQLFLIQGKTLDKLVQAETIRSYPGLSEDLGKLTASQYLAELVLCQALSEQPQEELFYLLTEHLERLERSPKSAILACLTHATFHLLVLAGLAPQVHVCCVTREPIRPDLGNPNWRAGFSIMAGGIVKVSELGRLGCDVARVAANLTQPTEPTLPEARSQPHSSDHSSPLTGARVAETTDPGYRTVAHADKTIELTVQLTASELTLLQQLNQPELLAVESISLPSSLSKHVSAPLPHNLWRRLERLLRHYAQYHFDRSIRSALLIDACFPPVLS